MLPKVPLVLEEVVEQLTHPAGGGVSRWDLRDVAASTMGPETGDAWS
jgi:hypothetical protein